MYNVVICDDNNSVCTWLGEQLIVKYGQLFSVRTYNNPEDFLMECIVRENIKVDIVFMDIEFEDSNGIDIIHRIQKINNRIKVIFITGFVDYVSDIFKVTPSYILIKPLKCEKLFEAVNKVLEEIETERQKCFVIVSKEKIEKVPIGDIIYFESQRRTIVLHRKEQQDIIYKKLDDVENELFEDFLRCHKSYLVNMKQIVLLKSSEIELANGEKIPVSRAKSKETKEKFLNYMGKL